LTIEPSGIRDEQRMPAQEIRMLSTTKRTRSMVVVAVLMGAIVLAAPAMASSSVVVKSYVINGSTVQMTVKNTTLLPVATTVSVQATVNGLTVWSTVPVTLLGGQQATVSAGFTGLVSKVTTLGISDDCNPY
jgi:hypothetical protein